MVSESGLRKESKTWSRRGAQLAHTWLWFAGPSLSAPVISLEAQLRAPPLTFKIKDKTLHDGALAANITRIGSGALRSVGFALHRVWFNRQESSQTAGALVPAPQGSRPFPLSQEPAHPWSRAPPGNGALTMQGQGQGSRGAHQPAAPPGALTSQPPIALRSPEAPPVAARCAPWL